MRRRSRLPYLLAAALLAAAALALTTFRSPKAAPPEAFELRPFVAGRPPVPVVFTSRAEPASFEAPAQEAEGFRYPGTISWASREGRLRLLDTGGRVYELTWGRELPEGGTLIDVMSPSVSLDGKTILFAGRKAPPDPGRWKIFRVGVDGQGLTRLTGGADDPGCVALPPLRFAADGSRLADGDRTRLDFDDVDPADLGDGAFAFASSRIPDLGRDHSRRATQIWVWRAGAASPEPLSANRNNDRWPYLMSADLIVFSLWSRNREAVTEDRSEVVPVTPGGTYATEPTDRWMAARVAPNGTRLGYAVKSDESVWRPRPLFNGRLTFMTPWPGEEGRLRLAQADWGYIRSAPSSLPAGERMGNKAGAKLDFGPAAGADGRELSAGCPSPCPGGLVLFSAAPLGAGPGAFGLYSVEDDWSAGRPVPRLLFDDPALADAEPVAVYARAVEMLPSRSAPPPADGYARPQTLRLASGVSHTGPAGYFENLAVPDAIRSPIPWEDAAPGRRIDPRKHPYLPPPPNVKSIAFYAAYRDRFDDPNEPRIPGAWEKLLVAPLGGGRELGAWLPSDPRLTTVLAGLDEEGKVATWGAGAGGGRPAAFFAYAGDHYSAARANGYHYCNGCHAGHTFTSADIREKLK
jgi:hypothetical protein